MCINRRNAQYILPGNSRHYYYMVDEKLVTKKLAEEAGVPCPRTYAVIEYWRDVRDKIEHVLGSYPSFVIKPNRGSAGRGIMVLESDLKGGCTSSDGTPVAELEIRYQITSILSGLYSLSELPDKVMIEQRIFPHTFFNGMTWNGTPDIRIILYHTIPVMAMLRLPTKTSGARANLHQGAVGVGIAIMTGITRTAVCRNDQVTHHPDTGALLVGLQMPYWDALIESSQKLAEYIPLSYIGVDFMLDQTIGPTLIEANARPGLNIQIANVIGLRPRLEYIDQAIKTGDSLEDIRAHYFEQLKNHTL